MADYLPTFSDLEDRVKYAIAIPGTIAVGVSASNIVNVALVTLWHRRRWTFRQSSETLTLTSGQSYIALAADYSRTLSLAGYPATNYGVRLVTLDQLNQIRQQTGVAGFDVYAAVSWTTQSNGASAPIGRLEIFPTPAATVSNALTHIYEKRVPAATAAASLSVPNLPPQYLPALEKLACGIGQMQVGHEDKGGYMGLYEMMIKPLEYEDAMSQPQAGGPVVGTSQMTQNSSPSDARFWPTVSATVA